MILDCILLWLFVLEYILLPCKLPGLLWIFLTTSVIISLKMATAGDHVEDPSVSRTIVV